MGDQRLSNGDKGETPMIERKELEKQIRETKKELALARDDFNKAKEARGQAGIIFYRAEANLEKTSVVLDALKKIWVNSDYGY